MAGTAETVRFQTPEVTNRQTDDILFNVRYLADHIFDKRSGTFSAAAESDVFEQNLTDIAESDVHRLGPIVKQDWSTRAGQYVSLEVGTIDNARRGLDALDADDDDTNFELLRRQEDEVEEQSILTPWVNEAMRRGAIKVQILPAPTHDEADINVAAGFGYDDRTMFRLQWLSPDGQTKTMQSFSLFGTSAQAWADYLGERYNENIEPTALAVIRFCNKVLLEAESVDDILRDFIGGVAEYVEEDKKDGVLQQLNDFVGEQAALKKQAAYYAHERTQLQKEIALSLNGWARPKVLQIIQDVYQQLNSKEKGLLDKRFQGDKLWVDEAVARVAVRIKHVTTANRAGLATLNEFTVKRMASRIGLDAVLQLAAREQYIQQQAMTGNDNGFMTRRNEQLIAESGAGCGGGCSVTEVDLFSGDADVAREAGLKGKLYSSRELDKGSKCSCMKKGKRAKVVSDGKNVVCVNCRDFQTNGSKGNLGKVRAGFAMVKAA